jgi:hypothetical protein
VSAEEGEIAAMLARCGLAKTPAKECVSVGGKTI